MSLGYVSRIRVDELIGSGGMGSVYKGYDEMLGRLVALKKADRSTPGRIIDKMRFLREARVLSKLNHPNICRIYDFIEQPDADYLVLEYLSGQSLKETMSQGLDEGRNLEIAVTLADVLDATHQVNVIHRDLKPENVVITDDGVVKVLDFGLARSLDDEFLPRDDAEGSDEEHGELDASWSDSSPGSGTNGSGETVGTLLYMSPEQANGEPGSTSSDLYSLGVILYQLFTGKMPYRRSHSAAQLIFQVAMGKTIPIDRRAPQLDPDLIQLINGLLSRHEGNRPSARETAQILREIRRKPERAKARRRWIVGSIALVFCMVLAILTTRHFSMTGLPNEAPEPLRIVVLPFINHTGDERLEWVTWGLRNLVAGELAQREDLAVINPDETKRLLEAPGIAYEKSLPLTDLEHIHTRIGATRIVRSTVRSDPPNKLIRFTIYDVHGPLESSQVAAADVTQAGQLMATELAEHLGVNHEPDIPSTWSKIPLVNQLKAMGDQVHMTSGPEAAAAFFRVCTTLDPHFSKTRLQLAACLVTMGKLDEAEAEVEKVRQFMRDEIDPRAEIVCLRVLARIDEKKGRLDRAEQGYRRALALADEAEASDTRADTLHGLAKVKVLQGDLETAETLMQETIDRFRAAGNHQAAIDVWHNFAVTLHEKGDLKRAEEIYLDVLAASHDLDDPALRGKCHLNYGVLIWERGDIDGAQDHYLEAMGIFQDLNMPEDEATTYNNLAGVALYREDYDEAEHYFIEALDLHREIDNALGIALTSWNIAELYVFRGEYQEADRYLATALDWYQDDYEVWYLKAQVDCNLGRTAACNAALERTKKLAGANWNEEHQNLWNRFKR